MMSTVWTLAKCIGLLFVNLSLGVIASLCGMILVASVNEWDDAPGGGILLLMVFAAGTIAGLFCGVVSSGSVWKHRGEVDQLKVLNIIKGIIATLIGVSLWPAVFIMLLTAPHGGFGITLAVAFALASWAGLLIYQGAKTLALFGQVTNTNIV